MSFDNLIGAGEKRFWNRNAERFGGFQIDIQVKLGGLFYRQFTRLRSFQYSIYIPRGTTEEGGVANDLKIGTDVCALPA
jgi:hypothetical protein